VTPIEALADPRSRRIAIFAHPDDETLWGAGMLIRYPGTWDALACSIPLRDPQRMRCYYLAAKKLGARPSYLRHREGGKNVPLECWHLLPDLSTYDVILTHGPGGEYGHQHHRQVHAKLAALYPGRLICSAYGSLVSPDLVLELTEPEWQAKLDALRCYNDLMRWQGGRVPTWEALLDEYGSTFNLRVEPYAAA
jgi:LmbE family N-acetylglucosaminyl deacetylase